MTKINKEKAIDLSERFDKSAQKDMEMLFRQRKGSLWRLFLWLFNPLRLMYFYSLCMDLGYSNIAAYDATIKDSRETIKKYLLIHGYLRK